MIRVGSRDGWFNWLFLFVVSGFAQTGLLAGPELSADDVIQKALARAQRASVPQPAYTYTKVTLTEELDAFGNVKERKEKLYQVSLQDGSTYLKLLAVNGHPAPDAELKKQSENQALFRQLLGQPKSARGDHRENFLTPELVARFKFTLAGQTPVNGRPAYQVAFQPRSTEPPARHVADRFLSRISGTVWIDAEEFEIARADVRLGSEVSLLGGVIGSLKKLAYTMTRTRVADGVWLSTFSSGDFEGRKLVDSLRIKTSSRSTNFRPLRFAS